MSWVVSSKLQVEKVWAQNIIIGFLAELLYSKKIIFYYSTSHVLTMLFEGPERPREAPPKNMQPLLGHCPNGGGGLNACQDGLGHLFREKLSMFKGAFACFGGV